MNQSHFIKILNPIQIKALDAYTIENESISSIDLMENAANSFCKYLIETHLLNEISTKIICGSGNNGGDGLAIARILMQKGFQVEVFVNVSKSGQSDDFRINLNRLAKIVEVKFIENESDIPLFYNDELIIDAIFGMGLNRPVDGIAKIVIQKMNESLATIIAVDIASGLYSDTSNLLGDMIVKPKYTISFELPKLAFFQPQNIDFVGDWHIVPIGLNQNFIDLAKTNYFYTDQVGQLMKERPKFSNKGTFGHGLLIAGSYGMIGAALLAAKACLRSGVGKLTVNTPQCGYEIMQITNPEAMALLDDNETFITQIIDYKVFNAIGIGPGLGKNRETVSFLEKFLRSINRPIVIDADALNIIAENNYHSLIPQNSILTPHPKEFERLINKTWQNDFEKLDFLIEFAQTYHIIVCLKGANTAIAFPNGEIHFNSTGNAGMAKGGTGDALTGILTALLAQGYTPEEAAVLGVFEHGLAGDKAAAKKGKMAMLVSDLIEEIKFE
ncbi:MAG: NAD(P)H-hydrate dehydratase [Bacteroidota bacterium]